MWKTIKLFPDYEASTEGTIRSKERVRDFGRQKRIIVSQEIKPFLHSGGYLCVKLAKDRKKTNKYVHRLVAETHIKNPKRAKEVNHIDGDRTNNNVSNLEWVSRKQNILHADEVLDKRPKGSRHGGAKLTNKDVLYIRASQMSCSALAVKFNCSYATVWAIKKRKTWRHI